MSVSRAGERVFDVFIKDDNVSRLDIYKLVGGLAALSRYYIVKNLGSSILSVKLLPVVGSPIICGLENVENVGVIAEPWAPLVGAAC